MCIHFAQKRLSESAIKGFLPQHTEKQCYNGFSVKLCKLLFIKFLRMQKIQAMYFKIKGTYFKIYGLYFLLFALCFFEKGLSCFP